MDYNHYWQLKFRPIYEFVTRADTIFTTIIVHAILYSKVVVVLKFVVANDLLVHCTTCFQFLGHMMSHIIFCTCLGFMSGFAYFLIR